MSAPSHSFSRAALESFLYCQRQFQLRYLERLSWPHAPLDEASARQMALGEQFHQLAQRHYLGLDIPSEMWADAEPEMSNWWPTFLRHAPRIEPGETILTETTLTHAVGPHQLLGRFDLLRLTAEHLYVYDWKTGSPRSRAALQEDWQTRLYLGLLAEGSAALGQHGRYAPEQISLTYFYVRDPRASQTLAYDGAWHTKNWAEVTQLVAEIGTKLAETHGRAPTTNIPEVWPLTPDLERCARCIYSTYCGRFELPALVQRVLQEREEWDAPLQQDVVLEMEPDLP